MNRFLTLTAVTFILGWSITAEAAVLNIQKITSPSGITAWLVEDHSVPVLSLEFMFRGAGAANDPDDIQGVSQMLSNTMDEGAGDLDARSFQHELEDKSISLHFSSSRDHFGGSLKTLSKYQDNAITLLSLALTKPRLEAEAVDRMRAANLSRLRSNMTDPEWMAARLTNAVLYKDHPYAHNSGGTISGLAKVTPDILRAKQQTQLAKDNLVVSVTGNITATELGPLLDRIFGALPAHAKVTHVVDAPISTKPDTVLLEKAIPQTVITMILPGLPVSDPDYAAAEVMDFVLGSSGFGSRLTEVVREQRGLTYGIYSGLGHMDHANTLTITAATKNESAAEVMSLTKEVMDTLVKTSISDKELRDAKAYLVGSVPLQLTSTSNIAGAALGIQMDHLPADYLDRRAAAIQAVTTTDVARVAKRLLKSDQIQIIMVGTPKVGDNTFRRISTLPDVE